MWTEPERLRISPSRAEIREDLPEPTAPTTATRQPGLISRDTLRKKHRDMFLKCNAIYSTSLSYCHYLISITLTELSTGQAFIHISLKIKERKSHLHHHLHFWKYKYLQSHM